MDNTNNQGAHSSTPTQTPTTTNRPHHHHHHPYNGGGGGREDCWSEGATGTLIDAWGDRYLQLSRGNLRQKDWKDVSDAVNARQEAVNKPRKTDVQCKNRIDTIKKKYKLERSKPGPSKWPFYAHLDELIGANATPKQPPPLQLLPPPPPPGFTVKTYKQHKLNPSPNPNPGIYSAGSSSKSRIHSPGSSESSRGAGDEDDDEEDNLMTGGGVSGSGGGGSGKRRKNAAAGGSGEGMALRELAKAIVKFGEVYERIESSKQQQMMELERQRMEFTKDLEFQRMQMFMEAQLDLEKTKRSKYPPSNGKKQ